MKAPWSVAIPLLSYGLFRYRYVLMDAVIPPYIDTRPSLRSPNATMAAVYYKASGTGSDANLVFSTTFPRPIPGDHQVLIEVKAVGLNPCDFKMRRNPVPTMLRPLPKIPGEDVAGVVVSTGNSAGKFTVGDRVAAMMPILGASWGAAAKYVAVNEQYVAFIPPETTFVEAASLPLASLTALEALDNFSGKKLLIHAGAGGVGSFAIQYAKRVLGVTTVATTASSKGKQLVQALGADVLIDYTLQKFEDVVQDYDAVVDPMSFRYEERTLRAGSNVLRDGGRYVNVASSDWALHPDTQREVANGWVTAKNVLKYTLFSKIWKRTPTYHYQLVSVRPNGERLQHVMSVVQQGLVQPVVDKVFPLEEAEAAYSYLEKGHAKGKVVLTL